MANYPIKLKRAFTLIELLIFMSIFTIVIVSFITIFVEMASLETSQTAAAQVNQQGQFLLQEIQYYVESARLIDMPADTTSTTLTLRESNLSLDPTTISASGTMLYLAQGTSTAPSALNSGKVSVSGVSFTRHYNLNSSSSAYGADTVSFSFTVSATSTAGKSFSQLFQSSASISATVPKIVMIQQGSAYDPGTATITNMTATYPGNNNGGGLLIALVANKSSGVSVTVSDSASNTWNKVASSVYSDYNLEMNLFAAMNSNNSSNTVKATFGANVTSALMYIYEYRGAATSSSFDVTTATSGLSTKTPSSGFVTPTSSVELLFGATYNVTTTEIPSAASSFTLESTSTSALLLNVSVEDSTQYITGPVSADWQYTISTPSSSALIATFK